MKIIIKKVLCISLSAITMLGTITVNATTIQDTSVEVRKELSNISPAYNLDYYLVQSYRSNEKYDRVTISLIAASLGLYTGLPVEKFIPVATTVYGVLDMASSPVTLYYDVDKYMAVTYGGNGGYDTYHMKIVTRVYDNPRYTNPIATDTRMFDSISPLSFPEAKFMSK